MIASIFGVVLLSPYNSYGVIYFLLGVFMAGTSVIVFSFDKLNSFYVEKNNYIVLCATYYIKGYVGHKIF